MKTNIIKWDQRRFCSPRKIEDIYGDCLERVGLIIPLEGRAIIDQSIEPRVGDLVHCNNEMITINGFIKQVRRIDDGVYTVGTAYIDESRDYEFEASEIYGVVTEVFCKATKRSIYRRSE